MTGLKTSGQEDLEVLLCDLDDMVYELSKAYVQAKDTLLL